MRARVAVSIRSSMRRFAYITGIVGLFALLANLATPAPLVQVSGPRHFSSSSSSSSSSSGGGSWILDSTHSVASEHALQIIAPQPSLTTASIYYRTRTNFPYSVRVGAIGGKWPYKYELTTAPLDCAVTAPTIDLATYEDTLTAGYAYINCSSVTAGGSPYSITMLVTDQAGATASVSWTITANTTQDLFLSASTGNDSCNGSSDVAYNASTNPTNCPKATINGIYGANKADTFSSGKWVWVMDGTYRLDSVPVQPGGDSVRVPLVAHKARVWIAYPGHSPVINTEDRYIAHYAGFNDVHWSGFTFEGLSDHADGTTKTFLVEGVDRFTLWDNTFGNQTDPGRGSQNSTHIFSADTGAADSDDWLIADNRLNDLQFLLGAELYSVNTALFEFNTFTNLDGSSRAFYRKSHNANIVVRANRGIAGIAGPLVYHDAYNTQPGCEDSYNLWIVSSGYWWHYGNEPGSITTINNFRNTTAGGRIHYVNASGTVNYTNNIRQHDGASALGIHNEGSSITSNVTNDQIGTSGIANGTTGKIVNTANKGLYGYELQ